MPECGTTVKALAVIGGLNVAVFLLMLILMVFATKKQEQEHLSYTYTADMAPEAIEVLRAKMAQDPRVSRAEYMSDRKKYCQVQACGY